jgi:hypothetical protein
MPPSEATTPEAAAPGASTPIDASPPSPGAAAPAAAETPARPKEPTHHATGVKVRGKDGQFLGGIPTRSLPTSSARPAAPSSPSGSTSTASQPSSSSGAAGPTTGTAAGSASASATTASAPAATTPSDAPGSIPAPKLDKPAAAKAEDDRPSDPKVARGWAAVMEKEAALQPREKRVSLLEKAAAVAEKGNHLEAAEMLGIDIDKLQDAYLARIKPADPAEVARKEVERIEAEKQAKADAEKTKAEQERQEAGQRRWQAGMDTIEEASKPIAQAELPICLKLGVNAMGVAEFAMKNGLGFPETAEVATAALRALEKHLRAELAPLFAPPPAPAPVPAPAPEPHKTGPVVQVRPRDSAGGTVTPIDAGEVPLRPALAQPLSSLSAHERAAQALAAIRQSRAS